MRESGQIPEKRHWMEKKKKKAISKALVLKCCTSAVQIEKWCVILQGCRDAVLMQRQNGAVTDAEKSYALVKGRLLGFLD